MLQCEGITQILLQITTWVKYFLNQQVFKGITKCLKTYKTWRVYSPKTVTGRSKNCEIVILWPKGTFQLSWPRKQKNAADRLKVPEIRVQGWKTNGILKKKSWQQEATVRTSHKI